MDKSYNDIMTQAGRIVTWDKVGNNDKPEVLPEKEHGDLLYIP